jgi:hypothetical protein
MTAAEKAEFLGWLSQKNPQELKEVQSHVTGMIAAKRAQTLRSLLPGMRVAFVMNDDEYQGTVVKLFRVSVRVLIDNSEEEVVVNADDILATGVGGIDVEEVLDE